MGDKFVNVHVPKTREFVLNTGAPGGTIRGVEGIREGGRVSRAVGIEQEGGKQRSECFIEHGELLLIGEEQIGQGSFKVDNRWCWGGECGVGIPKLVTEFKGSLATVVMRSIPSFPEVLSSLSRFSNG